MLRILIFYLLVIVTCFQTSCIFKKNGFVKNQSGLSESINQNLYDSLFALPELIPYRQGSLWGFADSSGSLRIAPKYLFAEPFKNGLAVVTFNDRSQNIIDAQDRLLLPLSFKRLYFMNEDLLIVEDEESKKGLYTIAGREILQPQYRILRPVDNRLKGKLPFLLASKESISTSMGTREYLGMLDFTGKTIIPLDYLSLDYKQAGIVQVLNDRTYHYFNLQGERIEPLTGYKLDDFENGIARICKDNKCGFADNTGNIQIPLIYDDAEKFTEDGLAAVKLNGKWGYINRSGKLVIQPLYDKAEHFKNGKAVVWVGQKHGLIDRTGTSLTELKYVRIYAKQPGQLYALNDGNKISFGIENSKTGKFQVTEEFDEIKWFIEGTSEVIRNKKSGVIDKNGNILIPIMYRSASPLKHGLSAVLTETGWGVVNEKNKKVLPFRFSSTKVVGPDQFLVSTINRPGSFVYGIVNRKGEEILPLQFSRIHFTNLGQENEIIIIFQDEKPGYADQRGNLIVPPIPLPTGYEFYEHIKNGLFLVRAKEWRTLEDENGKIISTQYKPIGYVDRYGKAYFEDITE